MDRHFILPVTIAAVAHAGLLFGIPRGSVPEIKTVTSHLIDISKIFEVPPEKPETPPEALAPAGGSPESHRPSLPDPPSPTGPKDFVVPTQVDLPKVNVPVATIPPGTFGPPSDIPGTRPGTGDIFNITQLDGSPRTRLQGSPVYPYEAKRQGITGTVTVEFMVEENGMVTNARAVDTTNSMFNESALHAVSRWKFEPGKRSGRVVRFKMAVPIVFSLNDDR